MIVCHARVLTYSLRTLLLSSVKGYKNNLAKYHGALKATPKLEDSAELLIIIFCIVFMLSFSELIFESLVIFPNAYS